MDKWLNMNDDKQFFSKIGFNYLIYLISALIFQIIIFNTITIINPDILFNQNIISLFSAVGTYILPFPILIFVMKKLESEKIVKSSITVKTFLTYISIAFALMWIGNIIGLSITSIIGTLTDTGISNPVHDLITNQNILVNLIVVSIIGPAFEEIFMRKLLIDRTIRYGAGVSIILSAVIFAFMHGNLNQFFYAFLLGGFFAYVYIKTGRITYTIILHIIMNLYGSVISPYIIEIANSLTSLNLAIIIIYFVIAAIIFFYGMIGLYKLKQNESEIKISLNNQLSNVFLNYGMVLFILFSILLIIWQIIN